MMIPKKVYAVIKRSENYVLEVIPFQHPLKSLAVPTKPSFPIYSSLTLIFKTRLFCMLQQFEGSHTEVLVKPSEKPEKPTYKINTL
jgi:hypothetical protein